MRISTINLRPKEPKEPNNIELKSFNFSNKQFILFLLFKNIQLNSELKYKNNFIYKDK